MERVRLGLVVLLWGCGGGNATAPDASADAPADVVAIDSSVESGADAGAGPVVSFLDTSTGIHAFLTFDYGVTDVATAATHADFVWGNEQNHIAAYRASTNPKLVLSDYIPFTRDPDGTHTLAYWQGAHPDWVLYQCDQTTPAYEFGDPNVSLDITNPAVVDWQVQSFGVPAAAAGYDMIAADNYTLSNDFKACGIFQNGTWKQLYSGASSDPQYTADVLAWAKSFSTKLHALTPKPLGLVPNFSLGSLAPNDPNVVKLVSYVDAILDEGGYTEYGSGFPNEARWTSLQTFVEYVQSQGKAYFSINEWNVTPPLPNADVQWSLASYLMSKERASAIFASGVQQYGSDNWRPEYAAAIGTPCGAMQKTQGVYVREYQHGYAIVNPTTSAATFTLPSGSFTDLYGNPANSSVSLPVDTGMVLLCTSGPRC